MTKIFVVSDVHLKLRKDVEFEERRFGLLIDNLIGGKPDIIIFNGDLLDRSMPTLGEIKVLNEAFEQLISAGIRCILLDGNHEAVNKDSSTYDYIRFQGVEYLKSRMLDIEGVSLYLCSWSMLHTLKNTRADILVSHYRAAMPGLYDAEINIADHYDNYKVGLLGDIHDTYSPKGFPNFLYTSSPYSISGVQKADNFGYVAVKIDNGSYTYSRVRLNLPQRFKHRVSIEDLKYFTPLQEHQYNIVVSGTISQLNGLKRFRNVTYTKIPKLVQASEPYTLPNQGTRVSFIDKLCTHVALEVDKSTKSSIIKEVLQEIQGAV